MRLAVAALRPGVFSRSARPALATSLAEPKACSSARLRAGPMPGISSSGLLTKSFLRRARCVPMAKRCASSRSRWTKNSAGSRGGELERLAARDEERLAPGVAVGPLGDRGERDALDAELGEHLPRRLELAAPAVDDDEVGLVGKRRRPASRRRALASAAARSGASAPRASSRSRRPASASRS